MRKYNGEPQLVSCYHSASLREKGRTRRPNRARTAILKLALVIGPGPFSCPLGTVAQTVERDRNAGRKVQLKVDVGAVALDVIVTGPHPLSAQADDR